MSARATPRPPLFAFDPPPPGAPAVHARRLTREERARYVAPHGHQFLELVYFAEPAGRHRHGIDEWETRAGDLLLIPAGMVHAWAPDASDAAVADGIASSAVAAPRGAQLGEVWVVDFTASAIDPERPDAGSLRHLIGSPLLFPFVSTASVRATRYAVPQADRPGWLARLRALASELAHAPGEPLSVAAAEAARAHLVLLLVEAARLAARRGARRGRAAAGAEQPVLAAVFDVIEARFRRPISLADVARAVGRSPGYLTTQVRRRTGRTVLQWIVERRLAEARRLLLTTDDSVEAIADRVGVGDVTHFIRQFRRAHGVTPAAWRRAHREGGHESPTEHTPAHD